MKRVKDLILLLEEDGFVFTQKDYSLINQSDSGMVFSHSDNCDLENCSLFEGRKLNKNKSDFILSFNSCLSGNFIICEMLTFSFQRIEPNSRKETCLKFILIAKSLDFFENFINQWSHNSWFLCEFLKKSKDVFVFSVLDESQPSVFKGFSVSSDGIRSLEKLKNKL
jgi:hypothetical protein